MPLNKISKASFFSANQLSHDCIKICCKCGGNGYTKTNPNCYKTCLTCVGKGIVEIDCVISPANS